MAVIVGQGISVSPMADAELSHESTSTVQNKVVTDAIASEYSTSKTYSVGDVCTHDGKLYECIVDIPTAEGWTLAHWKVSNLGDNVSNLNRQISDETTGLDTKAPVILETASGAIASFSDGADNMPIKKLVAQIEPVQNLHGYDHPWPAGGGVNKFGDYTVVNGYISNTGFIYSGANDRTYIIPIEASTKYSIKIIRTPVSGATENDDTQVGEFYSDNRPVVDVTVGARLSAGGYASNIFERTFITGENAKWLAIKVGNNTRTNIEETIKSIQIEKGTAVSSVYTPYSNECPISGWTGAEVTGTGKNLFDPSSALFLVGYGNKVWENGYNGSILSVANNAITFSRSNNSAAGVFQINVPEPGEYTLRFNKVGDIDVNLLVSDENYSEIDLSSGYKDNFSIVGSLNSGAITFAAQNGKYYYVSAYDTIITHLTVTYSDIQLELGSTATTYHPYTGNQISVTFPSEADTVYGATMTLNPDRTGTLVVTDRKDVFDDVSNISLYWSQAGTYGNRFNLGLRTTNKMGSVDFVSNVLVPTNAVYSSANWRPYQGFPWRDNTNDFFLILPLEYTIDRIADAKALIASWGLEICYKLLNPIEIPLTASEVSGILTTLYGQNNVWCDTGAIIECDYPADTKLYIDNKITQAIANALNS